MLENFLGALNGFKVVIQASLMKYESWNASVERYRVLMRPLWFPSHWKHPSRQSSHEGGIIVKELKDTICHNCLVRTLLGSGGLTSHPENDVQQSRVWQIWIVTSTIAEVFQAARKSRRNRAIGIQVLAAPQQWHVPESSWTSRNMLQYNFRVVRSDADGLCVNQLPQRALPSWEPPPPVKADFALNAKWIPW